MLLLLLSLFTSSSACRPLSSVIWDTRGSTSFSFCDAAEQLQVWQVGGGMVDNHTITNTSALSPPLPAGIYQVILLAASGVRLQNTVVSVLDLTSISFIIVDAPTRFRSTGGNTLHLRPSHCPPLVCQEATTARVQVRDGSGTHVEFHAVYVQAAGQWEAKTPFEFSTFGDNSTLDLLVSLDEGSHFVSTSIEILLVESLPLRVGWSSFNTPFDLGWSYACSEGRHDLSAVYGRSMQSFGPFPATKTNDGIIDTVNELELDIWLECGICFTCDHEEIARSLPDVQIMASMGGSSTLPLDAPPNFHMNLARLAEARYLAGMAAGGFALANGIDRIGYLGGERLTGQVPEGANAFTLGVLKMHPNAKVHLRTIAGFYDPYTERFAAELFVAEGHTLLAHHTDSKELLQVASEHPGTYAIGSNSDVDVPLFGDFLLTTPFLKWNNIFAPLIEDMFDAGATRKVVWGGMQQGASDISPLSAVVPTAVQEAVLQEKQRIMTGDGEVVFCGPLRDIEGTEVIAAGECASRDDILVMQWWVEGIVDHGVYVAPLPEHDRHQIWPGVFPIVSVFTGVMLFVVVLLTIFVFTHRNHKVIKAASWKFCIVILLGVLISLPAVVLMSLDDRLLDQTAMDRSCATLPWLLVLGFLISLGSLYAKSWRVMRLFGMTNVDGNFAPRPMSDLQLLGCVLALTLPGLVLLGLGTIVATPIWTRTVLESDAYGHPLHSAGSCKAIELSSGSALTSSAFLVGYLLLVLAVGNWLAYRARVLPSAFNESKWIALMMLFIFQACLLALPVNFLTDDETNTDLQALSRCCAVLAVDAVLVGLTFGPKVALIRGKTEEQITRDVARDIASFVQHPSTKSSNSKSRPITSQNQSQGANYSQANPSFAGTRCDDVTPLPVGSRNRGPSTVRGTRLSRTREDSVSRHGSSEHEKEEQERERGTV